MDPIVFPALTTAQINLIRALLRKQLLLTTEKDCQDYLEDLEMTLRVFQILAQSVQKYHPSMLAHSYAEAILASQDRATQDAHIMDLFQTSMTENLQFGDDISSKGRAVVISALVDLLTPHSTVDATPEVEGLIRRLEKSYFKRRLAEAFDLLATS